MSSNQAIGHLKVNQKRLWGTLHHTAQWGAREDGGIKHLALTPEDKAVGKRFVDSTRSLGCNVKIDEMGNIFAIRNGKSRKLPPTGTGSHLGTQPAGGRYDGILGVQAGVEILRLLNEINMRRMCHWQW